MQGLFFSFARDKKGSVPRVGFFGRVPRGPSSVNEGVPWWTHFRHTRTRKAGLTHTRYCLFRAKPCPHHPNRSHKIPDNADSVRLIPHS